MGRSKRLIEAQKERIMEDIQRWLDDAPHGVENYFNWDDAEQSAWDTAHDNYESAMEDKADMLRDEARGL